MNVDKETMKREMKSKKTVEERRQDILEASLKIFVANGYNGATTAEIAREAGVAEGTIFRHFATKKELLMAVVAPKVLDGLIQLEQKHREDTPVDFFQSLLRNRLILIKENDGLIRLMLSEAQYHPEVREALFTGVLGKGIEIMRTWYEKGVAQGDFRDLPFLPTMRRLIGMVVFDGIFSNAFPGLGPEKSIEETAEDISDLFLKGLALKTTVG